MVRQGRAFCWLSKCQHTLVLQLPQRFIFLLETDTVGVAAEWMGKHWETADL